jgi:nicotinate dehydrogenase subunit A
MPQTITLRVNGRQRSVTAEPDAPLLYILRNDLGLNGPKYGCGLSQCGACTVIINGEAVRSCVTPLETAKGRDITTLEGLGSVDKPHPVQKAFIAEQAAQCGYCANGMIMTATALLGRTKKPSEAQIKEALAGNLCRCGTHIRILRAVKRAAEEMA